MRNHKRRRFIIRIATVVGLFVAASAAGFALVIFYFIKTLPPPELFDNRIVSQSTKIYDRTGTILLYEIHGEEIRTVIPFEEIPDVVKHATIAVEDADFYNHPAFEWRAIIRAFFINLIRGDIVQGGSTITQQLAKKAFLFDDRTITRKLKELILAIQLEQRYTKDEILEAYLNQIPYGGNAYGIEAASQVFFGKHAKDLTLAEAALLAGLPQAPSYYSPWGSNIKALKGRFRYVLGRMESAGFITSDEVNDVMQAVGLITTGEASGNVDIKSDSTGVNEKDVGQIFVNNLGILAPSRGIKAPHFVMMVQDYLNNKYGEEFVRTNGLKVTTTLDWNLQQLAERVVSDGAARNEKLYKSTNAALVAEDAATGQILALVGSRDYFDIENDGNFNVATQGLRQPGSSFKPFVYAAAFELGYTPKTIVFDLKTEFDTTGLTERSYQPENYDGRFRGPVDLRHALAQSINVPAVKILYLIGADSALSTAKRFGITTLTDRNRYGLSLVLGGGEVTLSEMVHAYSAFAQDGIQNRQSFILSVANQLKGDVLESYSTNTNRVIKPQYARLINDILSDQRSRAPIFGNSLIIPSLPDHQIAVKTGTTNFYRDAWTIGYTSSLVVGVWAGNNDNSPMTKEGASIAAAVPIWKSFIKTALKGTPEETFIRPDVITTNKPMLSGEHIITYEADGTQYPQLHNILFYIDRNNPLGQRPSDPTQDIQFKNWEIPVLIWGSQNIPNFETVFNHELPNKSVLVDSGINNKHTLNVEIGSPKNGDYITNGFDIYMTITSSSTVERVNVFFNKNIIHTDGNLSKSTNQIQYRAHIVPPDIKPQNLLTLSIETADGINQTYDIILFNQP